MYLNGWVAKAHKQLFNGKRAHIHEWLAEQIDRKTQQRSLEILEAQERRNEELKQQRLDEKYHAAVKQKEKEESKKAAQARWKDAHDEKIREYDISAWEKKIEKHRAGRAMKQKTEPPLVTSFVRPRNVMRLGNRSLSLNREKMEETEQKTSDKRKSYPMHRDTLWEEPESALSTRLSENKNPLRKERLWLENLKKQEKAAFDRSNPVTTETNEMTVKKVITPTRSWQRRGAVGERGKKKLQVIVPLM